MSKASSRGETDSIFRIYSSGVKTNSDVYVYDFDYSTMATRAKAMVENFNSELDRWKRDGQPAEFDPFLEIDESTLKWVRNTKRTLLRGEYIDFDDANIRTGLYRPFTKKCYFFERAFNEDTYRFASILPTRKSELENVVICCTIEPQIPFSAIVSNAIPCLHVGGRQGQCFPFYVYDKDGENRRENITDWALEQFRSAHGDASISKWDIFYYVYGLLHHADYRDKFADNLKRELPRIPFATDFRAIADAGRDLAELHLNYEALEPYALDWGRNTTRATVVPRAEQNEIEQEEG